MKQEAPVGERELNEVDRLIGQAAKAHRGDSGKPAGGKPAQEDDVKSHVSKAQSTVSRSKSVASSTVMLNPDRAIRIGMQGKVIGMTDAEWTAQVNHNYSTWTQEASEKAMRLRGQRDQMRNELQSQMALKAEKSKVNAYSDK